jgi:hypothetical protein
MRIHIGEPRPHQNTRHGRAENEWDATENDQGNNVIAHVILESAAIRDILLPSRSKNAYFESYKISAKPREIKACGILQSGRFISEKGVE